MILVALTGNYGMGKSTILAMLGKLGIITLDSDDIVGSLLKQKDVLEKIRELMGEKVFDGNGILNKKRVADIIFRNDHIRHSLEDIIHPLVFERIIDFLDAVNKKEKLIIVCVPLLYEKGYEERFDRTIVVHTKEDVILERLEKNGIKRDDVLLRLKAQLPLEKKITRADFVIDNNGTLDETMAQVEVIYKKLLQEAGDGSNKRS